MCSHELIKTTWEVFLRYVNNGEPFNLADVYKEIETNNLVYLLTPKMTIGKMVNILEWNGLAEDKGNRLIHITQDGVKKINDVYHQVVTI